MSSPEIRAAAIRFAVLHDGGALESWQTRCLDELESQGNVRAVASIGADYAKPLGGRWAVLPHVALQAAGQGSSAERSAAAPPIAQLRELELDFILCVFEGAPPAALLGVPRHGIWRFHLGDWVNYRGGPGGFWEVYDRCAESAALLVRVHADEDVVEVLREGYLRTNLLSARKNREQLLARCAHWPAEVCREMQSSDIGAPYREVATRRGAVRRGPPNAWQRALLAARIALRAAVTGFRSLFRHDQWNIGIVDRPIAQLLNLGSPPQVAWLPPTGRGELRADPFGIPGDGRAMFLCEQFSYADNLGTIVAIDLLRGAPGMRVHIGPEPAVHLSYPFLFEHDGRLLCVPESSAAREIALYEVLRFPDRWVRVATLIADGGFTDATVFQHQGSWWMTASEVADKGANCELHVWFANAPQGPWQAHPGNPVKIDVRSARPAGAPFSVDGVLYRPAQDCSSSYGARVIINRVLVLTRTEFHEEVAGAVEPDPAGSYPTGLHTLSAWGDRTLVDGRRTVFAAAEFWRVLRHYLR